MRLNDMLDDLLSLAKEENEPSRYAHSEEYDKLYNELDTKTLIIDVMEKQLGCSIEEIFKFVKLLKKYYYVDITGQLQARNVWDNPNLNENELYKINHIFNNIKNEYK